MFQIAIVIGLFAYVIFLFGILGLLYKPLILIVTILYLGLVFFIFRKKIINPSTYPSRLSGFLSGKIFQRERIFLFAFTLLVIQAIVNLIGALGPEIGFDALWYHLTLPKLYNLHHSIYPVRSGILYYGFMPKLAELLYIPALLLGSEIYAKLIHFSFGILTCVALYFFGRKFFSKQVAIVVCLIFYSNLVVGWESVSAYIDLTRTFFELMALWAFMNFIEAKSKKWLFLCVVMIGFAITTKLLAIGSLIIFIILILINSSGEGKYSKMIKNILIISFLALLIPLPWFVYSYVHTGSPIFPFFTHTYPFAIDLTIFSPINMGYAFWNVLIDSPDPLNPIYIGFLPLLIFLFPKFTKSIKIIAFYSVISFFIWYLTPNTGGGRFLLPYLPSFSILIGAAIYHVKKSKLFTILLVFIFLSSIISISYRLIANSKFIPVLLGHESKSAFLTKHLNFSFGDFVDSDGYFKKHIKSTDSVLVYGVHSMYYLNFPFIDSTGVKKGEKFNYILVSNGSVPNEFKFFLEIYHNPVTHVSLYSWGGKVWVY